MYGNFFSLTNWKPKTIFLSDCTIFHHQNYMKVEISPYPHQHLLLNVFLFIAILVFVMWCLIMVLIFVSLMTNDFEYVLMCLLVSCSLSLENIYLYLVPIYFMAAATTCSDFGAPQKSVSLLHYFPIYLPWSDEMILILWS